MHPKTKIHLEESFKATLRAILDDAQRLGQQARVHQASLCITDIYALDFHARQLELNIPQLDEFIAQTELHSCEYGSKRCPIELGRERWKFLRYGTAEERKPEDFPGDKEAKEREDLARAEATKVAQEMLGDILNGKVNPSNIESIVKQKAEEFKAKMQAKKEPEQDKPQTPSPKPRWPDFGTN